MKKITVLGVTGSIGTQTIDVVTGHPDEFEIVAMSAGHNIKKLEEIMNQLPVPHICVLEQKDYDYLSEKYPEYNFASNKGYGTKEHMDALKKYGPTEIHRKTFLKFLNNEE